MVSRLPADRPDPLEGEPRPDPPPGSPSSARAARAASAGPPGGLPRRRPRPRQSPGRSCGTNGPAPALRETGRQDAASRHRRARDRPEGAQPSSPSWAAVSGGLFLINIATGIDSPWFLFPAAGWASDSCGATPSSGRRATAGGTCCTGRRRRMRSRRPCQGRQAPPPASVAPGGRVRRAPGRHPAGPRGPRRHLQAGRASPPPEREMLPDDRVQTMDALYERAAELARTLHAMDTNMDTRARPDRRADRRGIPGAGGRGARPAPGPARRRSAKR